MNMHFEKTNVAQSDCVIHCMSWMGKVPEEQVDEDGWRLNRSHYYQDGWLATGNAHGIVSVTYTTSHGRKMVDMPPRANFNLRGHHSKVILAKWNEPYQKLASCDSTGVIYVWIKFEGRWSVELINDRNVQVTDFSWSHDGRMALICYSDSFILVGSVSGQRYWSSILNAGTTITCGIWSPDDKYVMFGTTSGSVLVIDVQGNVMAQLSVLERTPIVCMCWSSEKFNMDEVDRFDNPDVEVERDSYLAICFKTGLIYIMKSYDDLAPVVLDTELKGVKMEWSNCGTILAVAGYQRTDNNNIFLNEIRFYRSTGEHYLSADIPRMETPVAAMTWAHNDKRIFICVANQIFIGWITKKMPSLQLLSRIALYQHLPDENSVKRLHLPLCLQTLLSNLFGTTIKGYLPERNSLRQFVSIPPPNDIRLYCTMMRHEDNYQNNSMTYTLFLEYLGGLLPILKGKRNSKLRPEFIIYDPYDPGDKMSKYTSFKLDTASISLHSLCPTENTTDVFNEGLSTAGNEVDDRVESSSRMMRETSNKPSIRTRDWSIISERKMFTDQLPESKRIVAVSSNLWGTKFKIQGLVPWLPAILGTITYRTSVLHLQPRQMTLLIKELQGPQYSEDISVLSLTNFSAMNLFNEDDDDDIADSDSSLYDETAAIAPMSPHKLPYPYSSGSLAKNSEVNSIKDIPAGIYRIKQPSVNSFFNANLEGNKVYGDVNALQNDLDGRIESNIGLHESTIGKDRNGTAHVNIHACEILQKEHSSPRENLSNGITSSTVCSHTSESFYLQQSSNNTATSDIPPESLAFYSLKSDSSLTDSMLKPEKESIYNSSNCIDVEHLPMSKNNIQARHESKVEGEQAINQEFYKSNNFSLIDGDIKYDMNNKLDCASSRAAAVDTTRNQVRYRSIGARDKERRVMLKPSDNSSDTGLCVDCYGDEMMHEQLTSHNFGNNNKSPALSFFCGPSHPNHSFIHNHFKLNHSRQEAANTSSRQAVMSTNERNSSPTHCKDYRASVPYVEKLRTSCSLSRSIPSSPETRRRNIERKRSVLYSPLLRRKMKEPARKDSSDDEGGMTAEEVRTMEFRDLESFQKAYIKKKLKKWRGRTVADGPQNGCNYQEYVLHNKAPLWNEVSQVYQLDFGGRVTQESAKNFQIEFHGKQVMQFGRIDGQAYSLDFQYPFSALQAFAVALANVTQRLK